MPWRREFLTLQFLQHRQCWFIWLLSTAVPFSNAFMIWSLCYSVVWWLMNWRELGNTWSWPNRGTIQELPWRDWRISRKTSLRISGVPVEVWSDYLLNTNHEGYRCWCLRTLHIGKTSRKAALNGHAENIGKLTQRDTYKRANIQRIWYHWAYYCRSVTWESNLAFLTCVLRL